MIFYLILSVTTFSLLGLFVLGALLGDVDDKGFLYMGIGGALGVWFWYSNKSRVYHSRSLHRLFQVLMILCYAIALVISSYGLIGMLTNTDILSGQRFDGMAGMIPFIMMILGLLVFLFGALFHFLSRKYTKKDGDSSN
ncbi:MAG: hypothetical protein OEZ34_07550 [Spirochaetia bacterium]|nr:hypothetical protein [Spirochaetia bacterium]